MQHNWTLPIQLCTQTELRGLPRRPAVAENGSCCPGELSVVLCGYLWRTVCGLWNNWFPLLQLSALRWAPRWWLSSGLRRPSAPAYSTRRSPEARGLDSLVTGPPAWWRLYCSRNDPILVFRALPIPNDLSLFSLLKVKFMTISLRGWVFWSMDLQFAVCLKQKQNNVYSKSVSSNRFQNRLNIVW